MNLGCITAEFFAVNHSIPGAVGVFFRSPAGNVLHTGDFKLDQTPIDGVHTDFGALARFAEEGVDLMMSDSTNATNPNFTPSEVEVGGGELQRIIAQAKGRVIIASFASHIHRLQQICDAAVANGRKVVVTGRSMVQNTDIARKLGYLKISDQDIIDAYDLKGIRPSRWSSCARAAKASPLSALARIAAGEDKTIDMEAGDTVIIRQRRFPATKRPSRRWSTRWPRSAPMCTTSLAPRACVRSCIGRGTEDHADHRTAQGVHAGARRGHASSRSRTFG